MSHFGNLVPDFSDNGESLLVFQPACGSTCIAAAENVPLPLRSWPGETTVFSGLFSFGAAMPPDFHG